MRADPLRNAILKAKKEGEVSQIRRIAIIVLIETRRKWCEEIIPAMNAVHRMDYPPAKMQLAEERVESVGTSLLYAVLERVSSRHDVR